MPRFQFKLSLLNNFMNNQQFERIPPHSEEAEKSVLGSILIDKEAFFSVTEILQPEDFYYDSNREIFCAMQQLYQEGNAIDALTVSDCLLKRGSLEMVGGRAYLAILSNFVPTTANAASYAQIIAEKAVLRNLINLSGKITEEAFSEKLDSSDVLDHAEKNILELAKSNKKREFSHIREVMSKNLEIIKNAEANGGNLPGIETGFKDLDNMLLGLHKADLIIIAARPSMGKTALALNIAHNVATKSKKRILIFSLEMPDTGLGMRLLSIDSRVDLKNLQAGQLSSEDWSAIAESSEKLANCDIIIDESNNINVREMRNKCRRISAEKPIDLIIIDYLQLMASEGKVESRQNEVEQISRQLKQLGREMDCPVIVMSQLSRAVEKRTGEGNRPMLSDLRDSGAIEQDADVVMLIYRADYYKSDQETKTNVSEIIVAKHRNGETGSVYLTWLPQYTKFANKNNEEPPKDPDRGTK